MTEGCLHGKRRVDDHDGDYDDNHDNYDRNGHNNDDGHGDDKFEIF